MTQNDSQPVSAGRYLITVGTDFRQAGVDVRERLSFTGERLGDGLHALGMVAVEGVILSTCNRVEVYALIDADRPRDATSVLLDLMARETGLSQETLRRGTRSLFGEDAVRHAFRVAAGLESMVLGEPQILGQMRDALQSAQRAVVAGPTISRLMTDALRIGKQARTQTEIARNKTSIAHAAVALAAREFATGCPILVALDRIERARLACPAPLAHRSSLRGRTALVVGAGPMATLSAKLLRAGEIGRLIVANRTMSRAADLAAKTGGEAVPFDHLAHVLALADVAVIATGGGEPVIRPPLLDERARNGRGPLLLIDVGVPRCVDATVAGHPQANLHDVDALEQIAATFRQGQAAEVIHVEHLIGDGVASFLTWQESRQVAPVIAAIRAQANDIRAHELERALAKLGHLSERDRQVVAALAAGITNKLLHPPTTVLTAQDNARRLDDAETIARAFGVAGPVRTAAAPDDADASACPHLATLADAVGE